MFTSSLPIIDKFLQSVVVCPVLSLDSLIPWSETISAHLDWWKNPVNVLQGSDLYPKDHIYRSLLTPKTQGSVKRLLSDQEKRLHILELKAVFRNQCQKSDCVDNSTVVAYINKQGEPHSAEMCALLWIIMSQAPSSVPKCDG